jgi:cytochrome c556
MHKMFAAVAVIVGVAGGILLAQTDSDYQAWMKAIAASNGSLQKNLQAKIAAGAADDAKMLESNFKQVEGFWGKRNAPDAMKFAQQAQAAAAAVSKAAVAGDFDEAAAQAKSLASNCGGCHMAHREKGDSGFKIK